MRHQPVIFWSLFSCSLIVIITLWFPGFLRGISDFNTAIHQEVKQPTDTFSQQLETSQQLLTKTLDEIAAQAKNATSTPSH